jgi:hypothetical protein
MHKVIISCIDMQKAIDLLNIFHNSKSLCMQYKYLK